MMTDQDPRLVASMYANLCSTVLDYAARQKIGGTHVTYSYFKQLPVFFPQFYDEPCPWCSDSTIGEWLLPRVLELTYTAWDLEPFARDCGYEGPPFRWDEDRRFMLRCELDAAFFHLYGVARDDVDYIMETFPVVRRNDDKTFGDYRTKLLILDLYDQLQHAIDTGVRYETILDPPPADPAVAHPARVAAEPEPVAFPDLAALADDAWTRSHPDPQHDTIAALAAVLQVAGGPAPARLVRIAAYLVLEPTALAPFMDDAHARDWRRVVGVEARPRPANTVTLVPRSDRFWSGAVTHLRGNGQLVEDLAADTWAPGTGLDRIDTEGWPQGRARAVWTTVRDLNLGAVEVRVAEYEQEVGHATA